MFNLEKLESLVKIKLTEEEKNEAVEFFGFFTAKFDILENINAENTEPLVTALSLENVMREDIPVKTMSRETLLENAPEQQDGHFVVPRILE